MPNYKTGNGMGDRQKVRAITVMSQADRPLTVQETLEKMREMLVTTTNGRTVKNVRHLPTTKELQRFLEWHKDIKPSGRCPWTNSKMYVYGRE